MVLCKKAEAMKTLKNGKEKLNKGYKVVETKNGKIQYHKINNKSNDNKKEVKTNQPEVKQNNEQTDEENKKDLVLFDDN
jgi:G3E family GTPase